MCQAHNRLFQEWLVTLRFPQGEKTSSPQLGGTISSLDSGASGQLYRIYFTAFLAAIRFSEYVLTCGPTFR